MIRLVVMMYVKYPLSLRNVEDLLAERPFSVTEGVVTARAACWRFECGVAEEHDENQLRRLSASASDHTSGDLALSSVHTQLS